MKKKFVILAFIALLTVSTVSAQISPELGDRLDQRPNTTKVDVIILTQPNANDQAKNAVRNANGNVSHDFDIIDGVAVNIPQVAAENLAQRDFVREIQPDYTVETRLSESTGTVNAEEVWSQNTTGEGVDVAVLDTGIEDNTILNVDDQIDYTGEGTDDLNGHGTHVAGTVASPDNEYRGVAYGADLFDVKVLDQEGSGSASDVIAGLEWAADNNADVATLSLGAAVETCDGSSSLSEAVDNTVEHGVTVTVASGNNGPDSETITAPGCAERPITVGSSGNGDISDFSSRGPTADGRTKPDLVAPGEGITSLTNNDGESPQFATLSGTSMATPHVAGTAALLLAEEDLTPAEVKNITTYTAEDLGFDENSQGAGRLDAYAAYQQVATTDQIENETENETGNHPPTVEALDTQVNILNSSAEAEIGINATDQDNETLNVTFYLEGEQIDQQDVYGEITHTATNLSLNTSHSWSAEAADGINTTATGKQSFNTDIGTDEENETEEDNQTGNETKPPLPDQASDTARKARAGFFNPNSPFYGLDLAFDRASVAIGLKSREDVMEERASEARAMAERGNEKAAEKAIRNLRETAGNGENATEEAGKAMDRVIEGAPEEAKQGLRNALENVERQRNERRSERQEPNRQDQGGQDGETQENQRSERAPLNSSNTRDSSERGEEDSLPDRDTARRQGQRQTDQEQGQESTPDQGQRPNNRAGEAGAEAKDTETSAESETNASTEESSDRGEESRPSSGNSRGTSPGRSASAGGPVGNFFRDILG